MFTYFLDFYEFFCYTKPITWFGGGYMAKMCVLEERVCTNCGECNLCDLDKNKVCDSCGKCIRMPEAEYYEIKIDEIMNTEEK